MKIYAFLWLSLSGAALLAQPDAYQFQINPALLPAV